MSAGVAFDDASWRERKRREEDARAGTTMRDLMAGHPLEFVRLWDLATWAIARDGYPTDAEADVAAAAERECWASRRDARRGALLHGASAGSARNDGGAEARI